METLASRIVKHFCKEENLAPEIWKETSVFLSKKLKEIAKYSQECYGQNIIVNDYIRFNKENNFNALNKK